MRLDPKQRLVYGVVYLFLITWFLADGFLGNGPLTGSLYDSPVFEGPGLEVGGEEAAAQLEGSGIRATDTDIIKTIAIFIHFALPYAGIGAFIAFVISGFIFLLGFGSDSANQRARKIMIWSAVGLILIIFAYPIVQFVIEFGEAA